VFESETYGGVRAEVPGLAALLTPSFELDAVMLAAQLERPHVARRVVPKGTVGVLHVVQY